MLHSDSDSTLGCLVYSSQYSGVGREKTMDLDKLYGQFGDEQAGYVSCHLKTALNIQSASDILVVFIFFRAVSKKSFLNICL